MCVDVILLSGSIRSGAGGMDELVLAVAKGWTVGQQWAATYLNETLQGNWIQRCVGHP